MDSALIARMCVATVAGAVLGWRSGAGHDSGVLARALALLALGGAIFAASTSVAGAPLVPLLGVTTTTLVLVGVGIVLGASTAMPDPPSRWADRLRRGGSVAGAVAVGGVCVDGAWLLAASLMSLSLLPSPRQS
jgi:hypothetical protein